MPTARSGAAPRPAISCGSPPTAAGPSAWASTGGFLLGIAFDGAGNVFCCDLKHAAVFRWDAASGEMRRFASAGIRVPNYPVVDEARGQLYVSDSRGQASGASIFRFDLEDRRRRPLVPRRDGFRQRHGDGARRQRPLRRGKRRAAGELRADRKRRLGRRQAARRGGRPQRARRPRLRARRLAASFPATSRRASIAGARTAAWSC